MFTRRTLRTITSTGSVVTIGGAVVRIGVVGSHVGAGTSNVANIFGAIVTGIVGGVVVFFSVAVVFGVVMAVREAGLRIRKPPRGSAILGLARRLLPPVVRDEYAEEWACWFADMRESGDPWYRSLYEMVSIVLSLPRLAWSLRSARRRAAVD